MPRNNQMSLSMAGSSGITVVNMIKIAEKTLMGLEQHLKQLLSFLASAWDVCEGATWVFVLCVHNSTPSWCCCGHLELLFKTLALFFFLISLSSFDFFCLSVAVSKFTLSSSTDFSSVLLYQCFYLWYFLNTTQQQELLCILRSCSDVKLLIRQHLTEENQDY